MGFRLSKIYTRKGDKGTTGTADGKRVAKDSLLMHGIGEVDELNSALGLVINKCSHDKLKQQLITIQHDLFNIGGELAMPGYGKITPARIQWLEDTLDEMNEGLEPLKEFILPGGSECACFCHLARTICRRVERSLVSLSQSESIQSELNAYINRLSDWLFVAGREINRLEGESEVYWQSDRLEA